MKHYLSLLLLLVASLSWGESYTVDSGSKDDVYYSGGSAVTTTNAIKATDPTPYLTYREGNFTYTVNTSRDKYTAVFVLR